MECEFPTTTTTTDEIKTIFANTKTIAIIGLSPDPLKDSHRVAKYLQEAGFIIVPIYPKEETILGQKVYRSLLDVPFTIDMVDVFRKADMVPSIITESLKRNDIKTVWLQKGIVHNQAAHEGISKGLLVVQNKCTMVEHKNL